MILNSEDLFETLRQILPPDRIAETDIQIGENQLTEAGIESMCDPGPAFFHVHNNLLVFFRVNSEQFDDGTQRLSRFFDSLGDLAAHQTPEFLSVYRAFRVFDLSEARDGYPTPFNHTFYYPGRSEYDRLPPYLKIARIRPLNPAAFENESMIRWLISDSGLLTQFIAMTTLSNQPVPSTLSGTGNDVQHAVILFLELLDSWTAFFNANTQNAYPRIDIPLAVRENANAVTRQLYGDDFMIPERFTPISNTLLTPLLTTLNNNQKKQLAYLLALISSEFCMGLHTDTDNRAFDLGYQLTKEIIKSMDPTRTWRSVMHALDGRDFSFFVSLHFAQVLLRVVLIGLFFGDCIRNLPHPYLVTTGALEAVNTGVSLTYYLKGYKTAGIINTLLSLTPLFAFLVITKIYKNLDTKSGIDSSHYTDGAQLYLYLQNAHIWERIITLLFILAMSAFLKRYDDPFLINTVTHLDNGNCIAITAHEFATRNPDILSRALARKRP